MKLSIILPCRNEELALPLCLKEIKETLKKHKINAEIIVSDSSIDNSPEIAKQFHTKLIKHNKKGYGIAYLEAFKHAKGQYYFLADCDGSYEFSEIPKFLNLLEQGNDLVIGNRFQGNIQKNAMPLSHKYLGNPILSWLFRILFNSKIKDTHCGMRAISKKALDKLQLKSTGMEFASEMLIKAEENHLIIKEVPINYRTRRGESKLKSISDGLRHLKLMLSYKFLGHF